MRHFFKSPKISKQKSVRTGAALSLTLHLRSMGIETGNPGIIGLCPHIRNYSGEKFT